MRLSEIVLLTVVAGLACATKDPVAPPRAAFGVTLALPDTVIEVGQQTAAIVVVRDESGDPIEGAPVWYRSEVPGTAAVDATSGSILGLAPGFATIVAGIDDLSDRRQLRVFAAGVRINEIFPNGERPGGWVEFYNPTSVAIDMSGWAVSGRDSTRTFTIPDGAIIPPGGYLAVNEVTLPVELGSSDAVHLFSRFGVQVDSYSWTHSPTSSYARCPDGSGPFRAAGVLTRKAANDCPESGQ